MVPNAELRRRAAAALQGKWQTALLVGLIASAPNLIAQVMGIVTHATLTDRLYNILATLTMNDLQFPERVLNAFISAVPRNTAMLNSLLTLLGMVLTPVLVLGMNRHLLNIQRGQEGSINEAFALLGRFFKALLLQIVIVIKIALWSIPGIIALVVFIAAMLTSGNGSVELLLSGYYLCFALMVVPAVMAWCRYAMSTFVVADAPETGVLAAIRRSKQLMKNRKGKYFGLVVTYLLLNMAANMLANLVSGIFGFVIAQTLALMVQLMITVYITAVYGAFYLDCSDAENAAPADGQQEIPEL
ncbi:MAG: DUF975 family protein [Clostridia bacterium]|nr:DUF975 family protein [Clostridia bacterium]